MGFFHHKNEEVYLEQLTHCCHALENVKTVAAIGHLQGVVRQINLQYRNKTNAMVKKNQDFNILVEFYLARVRRNSIEVK
jgi:hypothetical protein